MCSVPRAPCVCTLERRCWRWSDDRKHFAISDSPLCIRDPKSWRRCRKYSFLTSYPCVFSFSQTLVKRAVQRVIVRLPAQSPPPDDVSLASETVRVLRDAQSLQKTMHDSYVAQDHILTALLKAPSMAPVLKEASLTEAALVTAIEQIRGNRRVESRTAEQGFDALNKYAVDLTALAEEGKIDPVIGRDNEIRRVIRILCRR
jgi:ATP-dependent Clp protease ATP-binding subunit ClpA